MADTRKSVLITGCSEGGIGDAMAREFHRRGARVFATARDLSKVQHFTGLGIEVIPLDVADQVSIRSAVAAVVERTGGTLDILVNNAGGGYQMPILDADLSEARRLFDVNIWGLVAVTQAFAPLLVDSAAKGRKPRVVNIGSVVSRTNPPWQGIYNASKGALYCINDTLRLELRPLGVEVLHVVTGGIATKFFANATRQPLPASSVYAPYAERIGANVDGRRARKTQTCTPETYARKVVANVLSARPTTTMWIGGMAFLAWAGTTFGFDWFNDRFIGFMFGLGALQKDVQAGRKKVALSKGKDE